MKEKINEKDIISDSLKSLDSQHSTKDKVGSSETSDSKIKEVIAKDHNKIKKRWDYFKKYTKW